MKLMILFFVSMLLMGCSTTVPVTVPFPEAPPVIDKECPQLSRFKQDSQLSDIVRTVTENNIKYHECARQVEAWRAWYSTQKEIYTNAIKDMK